jgi:predicted phage-related endonuclease
MDRLTHNAPQGSDEWKRDRRERNNASEAAAMLNESPYITRDQLLYADYTHTEPEVSEEQARIFAEGHRVEALIRPVVEAWLRRPLYPVVLSVQWPGIKRRLGASFDGLTSAETKSLEVKSLNDAIREALPAPGWAGREENDASRLPLLYQLQMEQQMMVVDTLDAVLFVAAKFEGEQLVDCRLAWYRGNPELRDRIVRGWKRYEEELAVYTPPKVRPKPPVGTKPQALTVLHMTVRGEVVDSNLIAFRDAALARINDVNTDLKTDKDFADAKEAVKWCQEAKTSLVEAKKRCIASMESVDNLFRTVDTIVAAFDEKRKTLDNLITERNTALKNEIVHGAENALAEYVKELEGKLLKLAPQGARLTGALMPKIDGQFWEHSIKGMRSFDNMQSAANARLAHMKSEADKAYEPREANLRALQRADVIPYTYLFADWRDLIPKDVELFDFTVRDRIRVERERKEAEARKVAQAVPDPLADVPMPTPLPGTTGWVRGEPRVQGTTRFVPITPTFERDPVERDPFDTMQVAAATGIGPGQDVHPWDDTPLEPALSTQPTLKAGDLAERLGFALPVAFITQLGIEPVKDGNKALYSEAAFDQLCTVLVRHIEAARIAARESALALASESLFPVTTHP